MKNALHSEAVEKEAPRQLPRRPRLRHFDRSATGDRETMGVVKVCVSAAHLPLGQMDQLSENRGRPLMIVTRTVATVAATAIAGTAIASFVVATPLKLHELVAEQADPLSVALVLGLANRFTDLSLEPCVEPAVDLPLHVAVPLGGRPLPALADPDDLLQVLA